MFDHARAHVQAVLEEIRSAGLWKSERVITSMQGAEIEVGNRRVLNFCANNYLGLASDPQLIETAKRTLDSRGYGLSSVRFICGTQDIHKELERKIADFVRMEDAILYSSAFDANAGLFETLLGEQDAIFSDALNHASIIDGVRLCKAQRFRYAHSDMKDLAAKLDEARGARMKLIATDGVFSMDGDIANLREICDLAEQHGAMVMVDDSHATGFIGKTGRGTHELCDVVGRIDIITSTMGKALGGASGGFTAARAEIVELLRQRSRPYLFSNSVAPVIVGTSLVALELIEHGAQRREKLQRHTKRFRDEMTRAGFDIRPGSHPIVPIMLGEATLAVRFADRLLEEGIYVIGFSYPVVPKGQARVRVQLSAAHSDEHVERAIAAMIKIGRELKVIG